MLWKSIASCGNATTFALILIFIYLMANVNLHYQTKCIFMSPDNNLKNIMIENYLTNNKRIRRLGYRFQRKYVFDQKFKIHDN